VPIDRDIANLARDSGMPTPESRPQGDGATNPGADRDEQHAVRGFVSASPELGEGGAVDVVIDHARHTQRLRQQTRQRHIAPPVQHDASPYCATGEVYLSGEADTGGLKGTEPASQLVGGIDDEPNGFRWTGVPPGSSDGATLYFSVIDQAGE
jgi:hypothetical protein